MPGATSTNALLLLVANLQHRCQAYHLRGMIAAVTKGGQSGVVGLDLVFGGGHAHLGRKERIQNKCWKHRAIRAVLHDQ